MAMATKMILTMEEENADQAEIADYNEIFL